MCLIFKKLTLDTQRLLFILVVSFVFGAIIQCPGNEFITNATNSPDKIEFINGDTLQGIFRTVKENSIVEFVPRVINSPVLIESKGIGKIYFASASVPRKSAGNSIIRLVNDDTFFANFHSLDKDKLIVDTTFGGKLIIERNRVRTLTPSSGKGVIYDGPNSLSEWTVHNPGYFVNVVVQGARPGAAPIIQQPPLPWGFTNDAFYSLSSGAIGNFFELPDKMSLDFELSWRGNLSFSVFFYTDSLAPYSGRAYMILFTYRAAYLHRRASVSGISVLGQVEIPELSRESPANISIKVDKQEKLIALFVNDRLTQIWRDEGEFVGAGNGIVFNQQSVSRVKLSKIRITRWDGIIEEQLNSTNNTNLDIVKLTNRDSVEGRILAITNCIINIQTDYTLLEIPFERVSEILLGNSGLEKSKDGEKRIIRGFLREYGNISFAIDQWDKEKIVGSAPGIGKISFSPLAFRIIQFNEIQQEKEREIDQFFLNDDSLKE